MPLVAVDTAHKADVLNEISRIAKNTRHTAGNAARIAGQVADGTSTFLSVATIAEMTRSMEADRARIDALTNIAVMMLGATPAELDAAHNCGRFYA